MIDQDLTALNKAIKACQEALPQQHGLSLIVAELLKLKLRIATALIADKSAAYDERKLVTQLRENFHQVIKEAFPPSVSLEKHITLLNALIDHLRSEGAGDQEAVYLGDDLLRLGKALMAPSEQLKMLTKLMNEKVAVQAQANRINFLLSFLAVSLAAACVGMAVPAFATLLGLSFPVLAAVALACLAAASFSFAAFSLGAALNSVNLATAFSSFLRVFNSRPSQAIFSSRDPERIPISSVKSGSVALPIHSLNSPTAGTRVLDDTFLPEQVSPFMRMAK